MTQQHPPKLTKHQREKYAELLKERIYATITLLAVVAALWQHAATYSALGALGAIIGTVGALWLATLVASRTSHRIMHADDVSEEHYHESRDAASGLLIPAAAPSFFVLLSMAGVIELKTALLIGIILLLLSLFFFSVMSGRKIASSPVKLFLYSALQMGVGLLVIALKLAVK